MPLLGYAAHLAPPGVLAGAIGFGFLIGIAGQVVRSRTLIITGILVIALVSAYFVAATQPGQ